MIASTQEDRLYILTLFLVNYYGKDNLDQARTEIEVAFVMAENYPKTKEGIKNDISTTSRI